MAMSRSALTSTGAGRSARRFFGGKRADIGNQYFRSRWEANYARYLSWLLKNQRIGGWRYEAATFEFPVKRGQRFYTPDFEVTDTHGIISYHEVKGWMNPASKTKLKRMRKYHPDVTIHLIRDKEYRGIAKSVAHLVPGWET